MKRIRTVAPWRESLRWYSQKVNLAVMSVAPLWALFPEDWRTAALADSRFMTGVLVVISVLGILGFVGRLVAQDHE